MTTRRGRRAAVSSDTVENVEYTEVLSESAGTGKAAGVPVPLPSALLPSDIRSPERDARFFEILARGESVAKSAENAGYSREGVLAWREVDDRFAGRWLAAEEESVEELEAEAYRRAYHGVPREIVYHGKVTRTVYEKSDLLLMFRLKALRPDKYADRTDEGVDAAKKFTVIIDKS